MNTNIHKNYIINIKINERYLYEFLVVYILWGDVDIVERSVKVSGTR